MEYKRSSYCAGQDCVEVAWRKSSFSNIDEYVEVQTETDRILVRKSKYPWGVLGFTPGEWSAFVKGVKAGEFDVV